MARSLGAQLPDALLTRLVAPDRADRLGHVVVLATLDPYGWPHPALVSYGEILALDPSRVRLGLYAESRSTRHLRETGRVTLVFADAEVSLYVKAEAVTLPGVPGHHDLARFELHVRDVLDAYAALGLDPAAWLAPAVQDWYCRRA